MLVFGGGAALAGLAGVIGGNAFVTEPGMAATVGSVIFVVVVVGGMGSFSGAFVASLLIGVIQTFAVGIDTSLMQCAWSGRGLVHHASHLRLPFVEAQDQPDRSHPALRVPGADSDLPAEGPSRHAGGLSHVTELLRIQTLQHRALDHLEPVQPWC
jgi:hypothetical protein